MNSIRNFGMVIGLVILAPVAQAQTPFDFTECSSGPVTVVHQSNEITITGTEGKGVIFSHHENKVFDNFTCQVVAIAKVEDGKRRSDSYWKIIDNLSQDLFWTTCHVDYSYTYLKRFSNKM